MSSRYPIHEVRITLTVESFEESVQFYQDGLGLNVVEQWQTADSRGVILALGPHTTLELFDAAQAAFVDQLEVGKGVSGTVRLAFAIQDVEEEADLAMDGLPIPAVTMTDFTHRDVALESNRPVRCFLTIGYTTPVRAL